MLSMSASRAIFSLFRRFRGRHGLPSRPSRTLTGFAAFAASSSTCLETPPRSTSMSFPAVTESLSGLEAPLIEIFSGSIGDSDRAFVVGLVGVSPD